MNLTIRLEQPQDYRAVEELTREAFWGSMNHETCDGEHLIVHKLRDLPAFVPELDFVAEAEGRLVGHVIYSMAKIMTPDGDAIPVLTFGPLSVLPAHKRKGVGTALMTHSIARAKELGYRGIVFYGHPDYYPRLGFERGSRYGILSETGKSFDALMAMPLYEGAFDGAAGRFAEDAVYKIDPDEAAAFDKGFPPKAPVPLMSIEALSAMLSQKARAAFAAHKIRYVSQLQGYSGVEILGWEGMDQEDMAQINRGLKALGQPEKILGQTAYGQRFNS